MPFYNLRSLRTCLWPEFRIPVSYLAHAVDSSLSTSMQSDRRQRTRSQNQHCVVMKLYYKAIKIKKLLSEDDTRKERQPHEIIMIIPCFVVLHLR